MHSTLCSSHSAHVVSIVDVEVSRKSKYSQNAQYSTDKKKSMVFTIGSNDNKDWEEEPVGDGN